MQAQPDQAWTAGSPVAPTRPDHTARVVSAAVFLVSSAVLGVAFYLSPSPDGLGTHTGLGLPACGLYQNTGIPCATCGMTTSFSYAAHGNLVASFVTQPAGAMLAVLTAMAAVVSGYALVTGMSLAPIGQQLWRPRVIIVAGVVLLLAWGYKIVVLTGLFGAST
jgi:uncharacterized protein DUF2752